LEEEDTLGPLWGHFGFTLGLLWGHFGVTLAYFTLAKCGKEMWSTKYFPVLMRKQLATVFLVSTLAYNAHIWGAMTPAQEQVLSVAYYKVIRKILGVGIKHVSNHVLLTYGIMPAFQVFMSLRRLVYLSRIIRDAPISLKALIQATADGEQSYAVTIRNDLLWLWNSVPELQEVMPAPCNTNGAMWELFVAQKSSDSWKALVAKAVECSISACETGSVCSDLLPDTIFTCLTCSECGLVFANERGLKMHCQLMHGAKSITRSYAEASGSCTTCLKVFHTRLRLQIHLRKNFGAHIEASCLAEMWRRGLPPISEERILELEAADRVLYKQRRSQGRGLSFAAVPVAQGYGPFQRPVE
jgi:hypothetical protein